MTDFEDKTFEEAFEIFKNVYQDRNSFLTNSNSDLDISEIARSFNQVIKGFITISERIKNGQINEEDKTKIDKFIRNMEDVVEYDPDDDELGGMDHFKSVFFMMDIECEEGVWEQIETMVNEYG